MKENNRSLRQVGKVSLVILLLIGGASVVYAETATLETSFNTGYGAAVVESANGHIFVADGEARTQEFGSQEFAKYNPDGSLEWERTVTTGEWGKLTDVEYNPNTNKIYVSTGDSRSSEYVTGFDMDGNQIGQASFPSDTSPETGHDIDVNSEGSEVYAFSDGQTIYTYDENLNVQDSMSVSIPNSVGYDMSGAAISYDPQAQNFVVGARENTQYAGVQSHVAVYDAVTGNEVWSYHISNSELTSVDVNSDTGQVVATTMGDDPGVKVWDNTGTLQHEGLNSNINHAVWEENSNRIYTGTNTGSTVYSFDENLNTDWSKNTGLNGMLSVNTDNTGNQLKVIFGGRNSGTIYQYTTDTNSLSEQSVSGYIFDDETNEPLPNASIEADYNGSIIATAESGSDGSYSFSAINRTYNVTTTHPDYIRNESNLTINGTVENYNISLIPKASVFDFSVTNYLNHGDTAEYRTYLSGQGLYRQNITENTTVTSANSNIISVNENSYEITATSNESIAETVQLTAEYTNENNETFAATKNVTVANVSLENIEILPPTQRIPALIGTSPGGSSDNPGAGYFQLLFVALVIGAGVARVTNPYGGLVTTEFIMILAWTQELMSLGLLLVGMLGCIGIALFLESRPRAFRNS